MGLGLILGDVVYLTAVVLGLAYVAQTFTTAFMVLKFARRALSRLYIAWKLWTAGLLGQKIEAKRAGGLGASFMSGLLVTLGNPKNHAFLCRAGFRR